MVFGKGENVLAGISLTDLSGGQDAFKDLHNPYGIDLKVDIKNRKDVEMLVSLGLVSPDELELNSKDRKEALENAVEELTEQLEMLNSLADGPIAKDFCFSSRICSHQMSGTSMASPSVTGQVADSIQNEIASKGILDGEELYDHPDFSPLQIQRRIQLMGQDLGDHTRFSSEKKLAAPNEYQELARESFVSLCEEYLN